jgi:hypothetical protein
VEGEFHALDGLIAADRLAYPFAAHLRVMRGGWVSGLPPDDAEICFGMILSNNAEKRKIWAVLVFSTLRPH